LIRLPAEKSKHFLALTAILFPIATALWWQVPTLDDLADEDLRRQAAHLCRLGERSALTSSSAGSWPAATSSKAWRLTSGLTRAF
jgi:hypothetical protein